MAEASKWSVRRRLRSVGLNHLHLRRFSRGASNHTQQVQDTLPEEEPAHSGTTSKEMRSDMCKLEEVRSTVEGAGGDYANDSQFEFNAAKFTHPWGGVDYHLYLNFLEGKKGVTERQNGMFLLDRAMTTNPFLYQVFSLPEPFNPSSISGNRKIIFECFPIPEPRPGFDEGWYVIGLDAASECLFARRFPFTPEYDRELGHRWSEGITMYKFSIVELYEAMQQSLEDGDGEVKFPDQSLREFCQAPDDREAPGMELVIVLRCSQFIIDIAELFATHYGDGVDRLRLGIVKLLADWRFVLEQESSRSWMAARNGVTKEEYTGQRPVDEAVYNLYTITPHDDNDEQPSTGRINHDEEQRMHRPTEPSSYMLCSGGIDHSHVSNREERHIDIPFTSMLEGLTDLARDYPEVDTEENRHRLGELLVDIQVSLDRRQHESGEEEDIKIERNDVKDDPEETQVEYFWQRRFLN